MERHSVFFVKFLLVLCVSSAQSQYQGLTVDQMCARHSCEPGTVCRIYKRCDFIADTCDARPVCMAADVSAVDQVCHSNFYSKSVLLLYGDRRLTEYKCGQEAFSRCPLGSVCVPDGQGTGSCCYGLITGLCADMTSLFQFPFSHADKLYLLSYHPYNNDKMAETICKTAGGYLAEIDDVTEYQAIQNALLTLPQVGGVLVGASDSQIEGDWLFRFSGRRIPFANWAPGEPGIDPNQNCMILAAPFFLMIDAPCYITTATNLYFLCEIPWYRY